MRCPKIMFKCNPSKNPTCNKFICADIPGIPGDIACSMTSQPKCAIEHSPAYVSKIIYGPDVSYVWEELEGLTVDNIYSGATFGIGVAIKMLLAGHRVARKGWNGKGIFIELQVPDVHSKMTRPYIFIDTTGLQSSNPDAPKDRVPWLASQTDILAEDYYVEEANIQ